MSNKTHDGYYEALWPRTPRQQLETRARAAPRHARRQDDRAALGLRSSAATRCSTLLEEGLKERYPEHQLRELPRVRQHARRRGARSRSRRSPQRFKELGVDAVISGMALLRKLHARRVAGECGVRSGGRSRPRRSSCEGFSRQAAATSVGLGMPNIPVALVPGHIGVQTQRGASRDILDVTIDDVVENLTGDAGRDSATQPSPARATSSCSGSFDEVNRYFYEHELFRRPADRAADARERRSVPALHRPRSRRESLGIAAARQPRGDDLEHRGERRHGGLPARVHADPRRARSKRCAIRTTASSTAATRPAARR